MCAAPFDELRAAPTRRTGQGAQPKETDVQILLIGAGTISSRINLQLSSQGHSIVAQIAAFSPEASVGTENLVKAAERDKLLFVVAGVGDGLPSRTGVPPVFAARTVAAWANGVGVPAFAYPPSEVDINRLLEEVRRGEAGNLAADDQYRRAAARWAAILPPACSPAWQSVRLPKAYSVVTSPKGGTGKTTIAVNLAAALALSGITTYLVDADANAGSLQYHLRLERANTTMIGLLRRELAKPTTDTMASVAAGAKYMNAFTTVDGLPTLKVLPGMITDDTFAPLPGLARQGRQCRPGGRGAAAGRTRHGNPERAV